MMNIDGMCNFTALRRASRYLTSVYDQVLAPSGLRITQFSILYQLARYDCLTIGQLAEKLFMDRTTLSSNLKPLERDGFIVRCNSTDRRRKIFQLTLLGKTMLEQAFPLWQQAQSGFENNYGKSRAEHLRNELKLVLETGFDPWAEF
ncbi:MarR family transcriptional regulator [Pectobacterium polaris]|uniref:MarR family winged helix-turn-helix transcriptional regulator n=1 Tax=Pectobacterium polaris TaxID=2042057 RepID=UPI0023B0B003|nr:MarR family transcriptional regulator [Pectobacterium polaris]MDE8754999.1 MarR family transcriptional regulator [Pectobacterium polaris]